MAWEFFLAGLIAMSVLMSVTWLVARRIDNYGIIDAVWGLAFGALTLGFALLSPAEGSRKFLLLALVGAWSLRLGLYLAWRIGSHHPVEDARYVGLRAEYGAALGRRFFLFFQYQAWSVSLLSVPFLLVCLNPEPTLGGFELAGAIVWTIGFLGESLADLQMKRFRAEPANAGRVCDAGLWRYSRHPNYFFESVIWWGFFIFALGTPGTAFTIYSPLVILLLLVKVTGIPPSEKLSLERRGDLYRRYQARTSAFVPWFPKKEAP